MAGVNQKRTSPLTYEGGKASVINAEEQLKRTIMSCMLFEDNFYEDGEAVAERISRLTKTIQPEKAIKIMLQAKNEQKLRHAPMWMAIALIEQHAIAAYEIANIITRADEITELLAMYWANGKKPISKQLKKALCIAFTKFDEYQFAKYNRAKAVKFRDVLKLIHPKPETKEQGELYGSIVSDSLKTPDTWEVALSTGKDKRETWNRLIKEKKLGDLAFLRNIRNMQESGVERSLIKTNMSERKWSRILPFQFLVAAKYGPDYETNLEEAMFQCLSEHSKITVPVNLLVDGSGSMEEKISNRSELTRFEAACGLAILMREICSDIDVYVFSNNIAKIPSRRGFALRDKLKELAEFRGTYLWGAIKAAGNARKTGLTVVITDEQANDSGSISDANTDLLAVMNVSTYQNGVGYGNKSVHISGWSEKVIDYIKEYMNAGMSEMR